MDDKKNLTLTQICTALLNLSYEDLQTLNSETIALLRHKQTMIQVEASKSLKIGDVVSFDSKSHGTVSGKVELSNA